MKILVTISVLLSLSLSLLAQGTIDVRFNNELVDTDNMKFSVDLQCMRSSAGWDRLGSSNFPFYFNTAGLDSPKLAQTYNFNYLQSVFYDTMKVTDNGNWASLNIIYVFINEYGTLVPNDTWTDVGRIEFNIIDPSETSQLVWRTDAAWSVFDDNETTIITLNSGSGMDISLPVELSTFKAIASRGKVTLTWTTESEINNEGFEVYRSLEEEGVYSLIDSYKSNDDLTGHGNSSTGHEYSYIDNTITQSQTYWYKIADVDVNGVRTYHGPISVDFTSDNQIADNIIPTEYNLYQNIPNPFNPVTRIVFDIPDSKINSPVQINIYNSLGKLVKKLYQGNTSAGQYSVSWDGKSEFGNQMPSGIYFARLSAGSFSQTIKMTLLK